MLGAAGAACCLAAGTALGSWLRERRVARWRMIQAEMDAVSGMRLLLEQERPALTELLFSCAGYLSTGMGANQTAERLILTAETMEKHPLKPLQDAYAAACIQIAAPWERTEERQVMEILFRQLSSGTVDMRTQAAAACVRKLRPLEEEARAEAQRGGRMCMQLGVLLGIMAGIALW